MTSITSGPYTIHITNRRRGEDGEYVGRPSPLGNPYPLAGEASRNRVCDRYQTWFDTQVASRSPEVVSELGRLEHILRERKVLLLCCWCSPKRCHARSIADYLIEKVAEVEDDAVSVSFASELADMSFVEGAGVFDAQAGAEVRDAALALFDGDVWKAEAAAVIRTVAKAQDYLTTDDLWKAGLRYPKEPRIIGAAVQDAARAKVIAPTAEWLESSRVVCHRRPMRVWKSLLRPDRGTL